MTDHFIEHAMSVKGQAEEPPREVCARCGAYTKDTYYNEETDNLEYICDTCAWNI
jgi:hypothetical protein